MGGLDPKDVARTSRHMGRLADEFSPRGMRPDLNKLGMVAKADAARAVTGSIGDLSMSHWRRGNPIPIVSRFDVEGTVLTVQPAPRGRGPMRVLEDGRRARDAQSKVSFRQLKSGAVKVRRGKTTARSGATKGKQTWTHAVEAMSRSTVKGMRVQAAAKWRKALSG